MRIVTANSLSAKEELAGLIAKIDHPRTPEQVNEWLVLNLGTDLFGAWIAYDKDEPVGMIIVESIPGNSGYVAFDWAKSGVSKEGLLKKAEVWAKELELNKLIKYTNKSPTTYIKKYGWSVWQTVLIKEL